MQRREFILAIGSAALCPAAAQAQRPLPVVGYLSNNNSRELQGAALRAFRQGLSASGFVEGQNVAIEYRWADGENDRLPELAADLVRRKVAVIVAANGNPSVRAARAATTTIPIVFLTGADPVSSGLVASLNRPGGNITGAAVFGQELMQKRVELLHEMIPSANVVALVVNPANPRIVEDTSKNVQAAARILGLQLDILHASTERDFDAVFATLAQVQAGGLVIATDPFFAARSDKLAALALRHAVPAIFQTREFVSAGGLMSYGGSSAEANRIVGAYTGRILKGDKPADLPVQQSTRFELFINMKTAKALGLTVPNTLLVSTDEVIE